MRHYGDWIDMNNDFGVGIRLLQLPLYLVGDFVGVQESDVVIHLQVQLEKSGDARSAASASHAGHAQQRERLRYA